MYQSPPNNGYFNDQKSNSILDPYVSLKPDSLKLCIKSVLLVRIDYSLVLPEFNCMHTYCWA